MSTKTPAERFAEAKVIRYEHGGGRVYVDEEGGGRELIADLYREDMRDFVVRACSSNEPLREALKDAAHRVRWLMQFTTDTDPITAELAKWDTLIAATATK
jgi:hypothetical protein